MDVEIEPGVWIYSMLQGTNQPRSYGGARLQRRPRVGWSSKVGVINEVSHLDYLDL